MNQILLNTALPFLVSFLTQFLAIKSFRRLQFCIDCAEADKPQRFHDVPTPRAGGLGIFAALVVSAVSYQLLAISNLPITYNLSITSCQSLSTHHPSLIIVLLPAFVAGFYEDIRSNINPKMRLFIISMGAVMGIILMDAVIYDIGLGFKLPLWIAIPFTIFAVTGVSNAVNIIDGFNGLAGGVSIITLLSFATVSYIHGDQLILNLSLILISAISGFFVWNFPRGKVFLGDGGAYLIGFLLAIISILLIKRNPEISPWFPLVILAYPIYEVFFSIYRRKFKRGFSAFKADAVHLHTLVHRRISRNNPKTSIYIWILVVFFNLIAFPFRSNTPILILIFILFAATYVYLYRKIVRFGNHGKT